MTTGLVVAHLGLVFTAFLVMLNGYLRGSAKPAIDAVLGVVWLGLLVTVLVMFGWLNALLATALSFVYAAIMNSIARSIARRMLGYRTTLSSGRDLEMDFSVERLLSRGEQIDDRLATIARKRDVAKVLAENHLSAHDLTDQFWFLMAAGLGDLSWDIIASPNDLKRLLGLRKQGVPALQIAAELRR